MSRMTRSLRDHLRQRNADLVEGSAAGTEISVGMIEMSALLTAHINLRC